MSQIWSNPDTEAKDLWSRSLRSWELDEVIKMNEIINKITLSKANDVLVWLSSGKPYSTRAGRLTLGRISIPSNAKWLHV